jgi:hypothetical protein
MPSGAVGKRFVDKVAEEMRGIPDLGSGIPKDSSSFNS